MGLQADVLAKECVSGKAQDQELGIPATQWAASPQFLFQSKLFQSQEGIASERSSPIKLLSLQPGNGTF
jgi:hypothetical protein